MSEVVKIVIPFVLGFFSAVFAEPLRRWVFRARLSLAFRPTFGAGSAYIALSPEGNRTAKYVRVSVTNRSKVAARVCRAYLCQIERDEAGFGYRTLHHDTLPLAWGFIGHEAVDIQPGTRFFFDVFSVNSDQNRILPNTKPQPAIWEDTLKATGRYRFTVLVAGDNVSAVMHTIEFYWTGRFDDLRSESFPNTPADDASPP